MIFYINIMYEWCWWWSMPAYAIALLFCCCCAHRPTIDLIIVFFFSKNKLLIWYRCQCIHNVLFSNKIAGCNLLDKSNFLFVGSFSSLRVFPACVAMKCGRADVLKPNIEVAHQKSEWWSMQRITETHIHKKKIWLNSAVWWPRQKITMWKDAAPYIVPLRNNEM